MKHSFAMRKAADSVIGMKKRNDLLTPGGRLRDARRRAGFKNQAEFAEKSGLARPTLSQHENGRRKITPDAAELYARALGNYGLEIPPPYILFGHEYPNIRPTKHASLKSVSVRNYAKTGEWVDSTEWPTEDWFNLDALIDARYPTQILYGLMVADDSINQVVPMGGVVAYVSLTELHRSPRFGELVVMHRRLRVGGKIEITVREFVMTPKGLPEYHPKSNDPAFEPIVLGDSSIDIEVVGVAVAAFRSI